MISKEHVVSESEVSRGEYVDWGAVSDSELIVADTSSNLKNSAHISGLYLRTPTPMFWEEVPYSRTYSKMN